MNMLSKLASLESSDSELNQSDSELFIKVQDKPLKMKTIDIKQKQKTIVFKKPLPSLPLDYEIFDEDEVRLSKPKDIVSVEAMRGRLSASQISFDSRSFNSVDSLPFKASNTTASFTKRIYPKVTEITSTTIAKSLGNTTVLEKRKPIATHSSDAVEEPAKMRTRSSRESMIPDLDLKEGDPLPFLKAIMLDSMRLLKRVEHENKDQAQKLVMVSAVLCEQTETINLLKTNISKSQIALSKMSVARLAPGHKFYVKDESESDDEVVTKPDRIATARMNTDFESSFDDDRDEEECEDGFVSGEGVLMDRAYEPSDGDDVEDDIDLPIDSPHGTRYY